jgi:hypothetical protein
MADLPLLMALRVQGICPPDRAATACGCDRDDASSGLASLVERELAASRGERGFTITAKGAETLDKLLAEEGLRTSETVTDCYERFLGLNRRVLQVSSDWQVRRDGGVETPNDHTDKHYDEDVIDRLAQIHDRAKLCLEAMGACAPRFARYGSRLDDCVARLQAGDRKAFTAPLYESYHTVWFELHQDLLLTLGLKREE